MFGETAELKTPYAQLLDSWLKRSDKSVGEVAAAAGTTPDTLQDLRTSRLYPISEQLNRRIAEVLGREDSLDTLQLYSKAAHVDKNLRQHVAELTMHINRRYQHLQKDIPEDLLKEIAAGEQGPAATTGLQLLLNMTSSFTLSEDSEKSIENHTEFETSETERGPQRQSSATEEEKELTELLQQASKLTGIPVQSLEMVISAMNLSKN